MFWSKRELELLKMNESLNYKIKELNDRKFDLLFEKSRIECENEFLKIQNKRLEAFVTDVEEALKKLKGES